MYHSRVLRIVFAEDNYLVREGTAALLQEAPDVDIVGDDLHPIGQVKDFSPYIAKIKASGADTVITGNWGSDLALLIKAANENGYNGSFFTYYAAGTGIPTALGGHGNGEHAHAKP